MNAKRKHGIYIIKHCCCCLVAKSWLTLWDPMACQVPLPWNFPGKHTGMDYHFLLQGIFQPRDHELMSPALAGGFFTSEPPGKPTTEHYIAKKKEGNSAIYNNTSESGRHYAKWKKLDTQEKILQDVTYMMNLVKLIEAEWFPRAQAGVFMKGTKFQLYKINKS